MQNYDPSSAPSSAALVAMFGAFLIPFIIAQVVVVVGMWKVFEKAGKPGWASLIPIYSTIILLEIIGKPLTWLIWILIPCTTLIFVIWALNLLSKSFGQSEGFTVGLFLLPYIFFPLLGFGNYQYLGPAGAEGAAGFKPFDPSKDYKDPFNTNPPQA